MDKIAFLFTGQGSQYVGMAKSFYDEYKVARQTFEEANDVLNFDIAKLCFEGSLSKLSSTENIQQAVLTASVVAYRVYMKEIGIAPQFFAGHSLGEYSALTCAGAIQFADALRIVRTRGLLTKEVVDNEVGAMTIIDGIDVNIIEEECRKISSIDKLVAINCYNSPLQVSIAGHKEAVEMLEERAFELDGQVTPLLTSPPFHGPLAQDAAEKFKEHLKKYNFYPLRIPVISNASASLYGDTRDIIDNLVNHMTRPVRWQESIKILEKYGITLAIEMGTKNVLCNLVKSNTSSIDAYCYSLKEDRKVLEDRLSKNEQLRKHVPTVVTKALAVAVATQNNNWNNEEYIKGVVEPYNRIKCMYEELKKQEATPTIDQMKEALEMLQSVFNTKKLPLNEQIEWFNQILEETGTYYELGDFIMTQM